MYCRCDSAAVFGSPSVSKSFPVYLGSADPRSYLGLKLDQVVCNESPAPGVYVLLLVALEKETELAFPTIKLCQMSSIL